MPTRNVVREKRIGVMAAVLAALLFGASTPIAKLLLQTVTPWLLAALLYLGAGLGLLVHRALFRTGPVALTRKELPWLLASIAAGGIVGPVLLMFGLSAMPATGASLLLNAESGFTAVLAWLVFGEALGRRMLLGLGSILLGAVLISWPTHGKNLEWWPTIVILGSTLAWALDNNLTRQIAHLDATWVSAVKGMSAGLVNLVLAIEAGTHLPAVTSLTGALLLGLVSYGVSMVFFIHALRRLGAARTSACFAVAPFFGAALAVALGASLTPLLVLAGVLMAGGVWLHLTEEVRAQKAT